MSGEQTAPDDDRVERNRRRRAIGLPVRDETPSERAHREVSEALGGLAKHTFAPGAKLTFCMRMPEDDGLVEMVVTDDDLAEVVEAIRRAEVIEAAGS